MYFPAHFRTPITSLNLITRMLISYLSVVTLLYACLLFSAPTNALTAQRPQIEQPRFFALSTQNGLSQDTISDMLIDQRGFLYIGTEYGLQRWDGHALKSVNGQNDELKDVAIQRLFQDSRGFIWISTYTMGVFQLNPTTNVVKLIARIPYPNDEDYFQTAKDYKELSTGNILLALDHQIVEYAVASNEIQTRFALPEDLQAQEHIIRWILPIEDTLLIATSIGLYALLPDQSTKKLEYLPESLRSEEDALNNKHLFVDAQQRLWISTVRGLFVTPLNRVISAINFGLDAFETQTVMSERNVWRVTQAKDGKIWLGTDIGLYLFDESNIVPIQYILQPMKGIDALSRKDIYDLEIDTLGNLWMGTAYGGALYWTPEARLFDGTRITTSNRSAPPLTDNTIWSITSDDNDVLWVGSENGLTRLDLQSDTSKLYLKQESYVSYSDSYIDRIFNVDEQWLYYQSGTGLWRFNKLSETAERLPSQKTEHQAILDGFLFGAAQDQRGRIWFGAETDYYIYDIESTELIQTQLGEETVVATFYAFLGHESRYDNHMWMSSIGQLSLVSPTDYTTRLVHSLPEEAIKRELYPSSVVIDKQDILWIGYPGHGLYGLDVDTFEERYFFNQDNKLLSDLVYSLILDEDDNLWFSSHSGLHRLSSSRTEISHFRYGQALGVAEFNDGAVAKTNNGSLYFGTPNGLVSFKPSTLKIQIDSESLMVEPVRTAITEVSIENRDLNLPLTDIHGTQLTLNHDDYGLNIRFSNLAFNQTGIARYRYQLEKNGQTISTTQTNQPFVNLAKLEPGQYVFSVTPDVDGNSSSPATLTILVKEPPWNTTSAKLSYAFLIGLICFVVYAIRHKQQVKLKQAQNQIRLFGNAFEQTRDWVMIFDSTQRPLALNTALEHAFGLVDQPNINAQFVTLELKFPELLEYLKNTFAKLVDEEHWRAERQLTLADGLQHDVVIDVSAVVDENQPNQINHYLVVFSDVSEQKNAERKLLEMATYDGLTGLVNRSLLLDRLEHAIENAQRHQTKVAALFIDLDRFKGINDSLGHDYGDKILQVIAQRMSSTSRQNDTVGRIGGDEFVILLEGIDGFEDVSSFIAALIPEIEKPIQVKSENLQVSCSIGVSIYPNDGLEPSELLRYADVAMYSAKNDPVNQFRFFTEQMNTSAKNRLAVENRIKQAVQKDAFFNVYQPIVNADTLRTEGMELLLRCEDGNTPISPAEFIPILEEMRMIVDVTRTSLVKAVEQLSRWYQQGFNGYLSVNLSALHFSTPFDLAGLSELLAHYDLPHCALRFEITESVLMGDKDAALEQFNALQNAGYQLALDDFGTGYSSLSYLQTFPVDVIKIDRSFTANIGIADSNNSLVITTIGMAHNMGMQCIAEGIETPEQMHFLIEQGCIKLQGYYFSKPVAAEEAIGLATIDWRNKFESD